MDADVLVVGYGPVGQLLALLLGRAGHKVVVVERWPALFAYPRAVHYDHEVARIFQTAGVIEPIQAISSTAEMVYFLGAERQVLFSERMNGASQSGWPFANGFSQPELEAVLDNAVKDLPNVQVLRGWEANAIAQDEDGVDLTAQAGSTDTGKWVLNAETKTLRARFVIGADGANSFVRTALDSAFTDLGFAFDWLVINVKWKPGFDKDFGIENICDPKRPTTVVPGGPGRRRWEFMLVPGDVRAEMESSEMAWNLLAPWEVTPDNAILERHAIYTFRGSWAENWRNGRILVAGDAAHLMPPFMGQGMCSGTRDAMNLFWQLDLVLKAEQPMSFLDNYVSERLAHVKQFIAGSVERGRIVCIADPQQAAERDARILAARADPALAPPPPPPPRLGAGIIMEGNPQAGLLSFQSQVEVNGERGLFDDLVGHGFVLVGTSIDPAANLTAENLAFLQRLGTTIAQVSNEGPVRDVDGAYARWFEERNIGATLYRPDFYQFAATSDPQELNIIVDQLRRKMTLNAS